MTRRKTRQLSLIAFSAIAMTIPGLAPAHAGMTCDDPRITEKLPKLPDGCQKERISSSGNQRPTILWARRSVEDHWQDEVINKYGERFADPANAACAKQECGPSTIAGFSRCTFSGFPCATTPYLDDILELSRNEVMEMQRLLTRHGFPVVEDGRFGAKTHDALVDWQKSRNMAEDGQPTKENLERLRKG